MPEHVLAGRSFTSIADIDAAFAAWVPILYGAKPYAWRASCGSFEWSGYAMILVDDAVHAENVIRPAQAVPGIIDVVGSRAHRPLS